MKGCALDFAEGAVVVAGGTGGIGAAICRRFADAGAPVAFSYHSNAAQAEALGREIEAGGGQYAAIALDLADPDAVETLFACARNRFGRIAHAVYASGPGFEFAKVGDIPTATWRRVIEVDVHGAFNFVQSAVRCFRAQDGGNLVAVITAAVERVAKADILSAAPKAAIEMLVRGVAKESGKLGIRANCVAPGWIDTGLGSQSLAKLKPELVARIRASTIPLQRFGTADDVASAVLFLCSRQAGFVTGQSLAVDGGAQI